MYIKIVYKYISIQRSCLNYIVLFMNKCTKQILIVLHFYTTKLYKQYNIYNNANNNTNTISIKIKII
jgi:hypothetical protein